jgi:peptidyl-prolyl cis-trans isomerase A (cyclophilin A)
MVHFTFILAGSIMKSKIYQIHLLLAVLFVCSCGTANPKVNIATELGDITIELYPDKAPVTVANFLRYVDEDLFGDARFYRTVTMDNQPDNDVKIEVIQGGLFTDDYILPPIQHETTLMTGLKHLNGTVSMARVEPGTASSEIFICIGNQPALDFGGKRNPDGQGFAAFGRVISGMDVVRKIHALPESGQHLEPHLPINSIARSNIKAPDLDQGLP